MIRFALRWCFRLAAFALAVAAVSYFFRDVLLREWLRHRLQAITGLETRLAGASLNVREPSLRLDGLHLRNSPDFGGSTLLDLPELRITWDRTSLGRGEIRLAQARLHIAHASGIRSADGRTNLVVLRDTATRNAALYDLALLGPPGFAFAGIDRLDLTLGTLELVDLAPPGYRRSLNVAVTNEVLRDVRTLEDLNPLLLRVLLREIGAGLADGLKRNPTPPPSPSTPSPAPAGPTNPGSRLSPERHPNR